MRDGRGAISGRCGLRSLLALGLATAACGGGGEGGAANPATPRTTHTCGLQVRKTSGGPYTGKGSEVGPRESEEAAWADVCAKLPETERPTCRDETKWQVTKSSSEGGSGRQGEVDTSIQLVAIAPAFAGEGSSEVSSAEACKAALADACAKAGVPGDCLAAGYEKQDEVIGKTTRVAGP